MIDPDLVEWNKMDSVAWAIHHWANETFPGRKPDSSLFKLVMEEIPEILQHKKKYGVEGIGDELADCIILLFDLSVIWDISLSSALERKMRINLTRTWNKDENTGFYNHGPGTTAIASPSVLKDVRESIKKLNTLPIIDDLDSEGGTCD